MAQRNTKLTQEEFLERMNKINPNIKILSKYTKRKDRVECLCLKCGHIWNPMADKLLTGRGCPICAWDKRTQCKPYSHEVFIEKFNKVKNKDIILLNKYINSSIKLHCKCKKCGNEWYVTPQTLLDGRGCFKCGVEIIKSKTRISHDEFMKRFSIMGNPRIEIIGKYISMSHSIKVRCKECGKKWDANPTKILYCGSGCYDCYRKHNYGENNPLWNPNITDDERIIKRHYLEYEHFIKDVLKRDNYICQITGQVGQKLNVHHLNGYNWDKENRTNVDNGITLSEKIHHEFHDIYGYGNNTKTQFIEFIEMLFKNNRITNEKYNLLMNKLK